MTPEKIQHSMEQLSLGTAATEPVLYSPRAAATEPKCPRACAPQQEKPLHEKPRSTMTSSLHLPQLEKAHAAVKTQYGQKLIVSLSKMESKLHFLSITFSKMLQFFKTFNFFLLLSGL